MTFCLYLGHIAMWYLTFGKILELMLVCVLVSLQVMLLYFDLFKFYLLFCLYYIMYVILPMGILNCSLIIL